MRSPSLRKFVSKRVLGIPLWELATVLVVGGILAYMAYSFSDLIPASVSRYLSFAKWAFVVVAAGLTVLVAYKSHSQSPDATGRIVLIGAMVTLIGASFDVPDKVDPPEYHALLERNAYPDPNLPPSERIRLIARRIDRSETDPFRLAQGKLGLKQYDDALRLLDLVAEDLEPSIDALSQTYLYKAAAYFDLEHFDSAVRELDRAIYLNPRSIQAYVLKCAALRRLDSLQTALATCDRAIAIDRRNPLAWNNRGAVLLRLGEDDQAIGALKIAIEAAPTDPRPWNNLALAYWDKEQRMLALAATDSALRRSPDFLGALMTRASVLRELHRYAESKAVYQRILRKNVDDAEIWINYGNLLFDAQQPDEALAAFRAALQLKPNCENAIYNLGDKLVDLHRYQEAIPYLQRTLQLKPRDFDAWQRLGDAYKGLGNTHAADSAYARARAINPNYETSLSLEGFEC